MDIAIVDGNRARPSPGITGTCQNCGREMIAKCGELLVWHWAHKNRRKCDPWWENEGPWHKAWKRNFPEECWEVPARDSDGEAHIADVRLPNGLVIELQHSQMSLVEMRSREAFYKRMIWIVDAQPFIKNFTILSPLPDPAHPMVEDLVFAVPQSSWLRWRHPNLDDFSSLMFFRRSEKEEGLELQLLHSGRELNEYFEDTYVGHHQFFWQRPREIWLQTSMPTYLDIGNGVLAQILRYGDRPNAMMCIQICGQEGLVNELMCSGDLTASRSRSRSCL